MVVLFCCVNRTLFHLLPALSTAASLAAVAAAAVLQSLQRVQAELAAVQMAATLQGWHQPVIAIVARKFSIISREVFTNLHR
jgi:hypothetical protein